MQIGHTGRNRFEEVALAAGLLVIAIRTALPIGGSVGAYGLLALKIVFGVLIAIPSVCLLLAGTLKGQRRALFLACATYFYTGVLVLAVDWTRFGTAGALFVLAAVAIHLHYKVARVIRWMQTPSSSRSSRPSEGPQSSS